MSSAGTAAIFTKCASFGPMTPSFSYILTLRLAVSSVTRVADESTGIAVAKTGDGYGRGPAVETTEAGDRNKILAIGGAKGRVNWDGRKQNAYPHS